MKPIGILLIVAGLVWAVIAFNMSTTVTAGGERIGSGEYAINVPRVTVNNVGLMEQRRNHLMMAGVAIIGGIVLFGFGSLSTPEASAGSRKLRACPFCAERIKIEATVCRYCQHDVPSVAVEAAAALERVRHADRQKTIDAEAIEKIEALKPKGQCPNCNALVSLGSLECSKCKASFGTGSAWELRVVR